MNTENHKNKIMNIIHRVIARSITSGYDQAKSMLDMVQKTMTPVPDTFENLSEKDLEDPNIGDKIFLNVIWDKNLKGLWSYFKYDGKEPGPDYGKDFLKKPIAIVILSDHKMSEPKLLDEWWDFTINSEEWHFGIDMKWDRKMLDDWHEAEANYSATRRFEIRNIPLNKEEAKKVLEHPVMKMDRPGFDTLYRRTDY